MELSPEIAILTLLLVLTLCGLGVLGAILLRRSGGAAQAQATLLTQMAGAHAELVGRVQQLAEATTAQRESIAQAQAALAVQLNERLDAVSQRVGASLSEGAAKTFQTLDGLSARLATIDAAQQTITTLSKEVVGLQDILSNKQARGAFGETLLENIVTAALAARTYSFQATLSTGTRADCLVLLPHPPGPIVVDAKFPLEAYREILAAPDERARTEADRKFRFSVQKHATAIRDRYIVPGETADSALMFLPSEAVYAELYARFPDVVDAMHRLKVFAVSPTTLMATLHTMRAVMKDARMHAQAGIIQKEVGKLTDDVRRFQDRIEALQKHFGQANDDLRKLAISAEGIVRHATRIREVELDDGDGMSEALPGAPTVPVPRSVAAITDATD